MSGRAGHPARYVRVQCPRRANQRREYRGEKPVAKLGGRHRSSVVELSIRNRAVVGSNPTGGSLLPAAIASPSRARACSTTACTSLPVVVLRAAPPRSSLRLRAAATARSGGWGDGGDWGGPEVGPARPP